MCQNARPEIGSHWQDLARSQDYRVIALVDDGDHTWVHYARNRDGAEYSCWVASFLERFQEIRNA